MLSGRDVPRGRTITAVAGLTPGSVSGAEPRLGPRAYGSAVLKSSNTTIAVGSDGVARVRSRLRYGVPEDGDRLRVSEPVRRNVSFTEDRVFRVSTPTATLADGRRLGVRTLPVGDDDDEDQAWSVSLPEGQRMVDLTLEWEVRGAVASDGDTARFSWPVPSVVSGSEDHDGRVVWEFPAPVGRLECRRPDGTTCSLLSYVKPVVDGGRVSVTWQQDTPLFSSSSWFTAELPAAAVGNPAPVLERSRRLATAVSTGAGIGGGLVGGAAMWVLGAALGRRRVGTPDQRFADAPPGVVGSGPVTEDRRRGRAPVRFEPPECSVTQAGFLLDGSFHPRQTAATLVSMATRGLVVLSSRPLTVTRAGDRQPSDPTERSLWSRASKPGNTRPLADKKARAMNVRVEQDFTRALTRGDLFRADSTAGPLEVLRIGLYLVFPALAALALALHLPSPVPAVLVACAIGMGVGLARGARRRRKSALTARGTALLEQVEGFRTYLHTAESRQLDFEADRDIFREFLPWAVLFGETRRWTRVCQKMADAGQIPPPDVSFWVGAGSLHDVGSGLGSFSRNVGSAAVSADSGGSGGSGGSSGFSGGSSGGGGGGGTSASSW